MDFPRHPLQPPLDVAGGPDELILQIDFGFPAVARLAQPVRAHQFTVRSFDRVARFRPLKRCSHGVASKH